MASIWLSVISRMISLRIQAYCGWVPQEVKSRGCREERQGFWLKVSVRSQCAAKALTQSILPVASVTALQSLGDQKASIIAQSNSFHTAFRDLSSPPDWPTGPPTHLSKPQCCHWQVITLMVAYMCGSLLQGFFLSTLVDRWTVDFSQKVVAGLSHPSPNTALHLSLALHRYIVCILQINAKQTFTAFKCLTNLCSLYCLLARCNL